MAPSYIAGAVIVIAQLLPLIGINVDANALTTTITTLAQIGAGLLIMYRQLTAGRSNVVGARPDGFRG